MASILSPEVLEHEAAALMPYWLAEHHEVLFVWHQPDDVLLAHLLIPHAGCFSEAGYPHTVLHLPFDGPASAFCQKPAADHHSPV